MSQGELQYVDDLEAAAIKLRTFIDRIRRAPRGYSGLFDAEKINEKELELFYQLKGFTEEEARTLVARLREQPEDFLKTLQEELGLSETTFPNAWKACLSATASTTVGGIIPVIPFFFTRGTPAVVWAAALSIVAGMVTDSQRSSSIRTGKTSVSGYIRAAPGSGRI